MPVNLSISRFFFLFSAILILPILLLFSSFSTFDSLIEDNEIKQASHEMEELLTQVENVHDDAIFFHLFLQNLFKKHDNSNSSDSARLFYAQVKKQFRSQANLIIWDESGRLVHDLSDEKRFQYVFRKIYQSIQDMAAMVKFPFNVFPEQLNSISQNLPLFRSYFGSLLVAEKMDLPLHHGIRGRVVEFSNEPQKGFLWYQLGRNFSTLVFLNINLKGRFVGLKSLLQHINKSSSTTKIGFFSLPDLAFHGPELSEKTMANLQLQAQSYLKSSFDLQTSEIFHSRFRLVSSDILCFAFREKKAGHSPSMRIFFSSLAVLGIFSFIIFCYSLKSADFLFSIKTRILSLMIFAAALPCLAFALIGYEYFHHKTNNLIQFHQVEGQRILKEFDSLYPLKKQEIAGKIEEISSDFFKSVPRGEFTKKHLDQLQRLMSRFKPAEFAFFDYSSNIWHLSRANQESFTHFNVLKMFLEEIIEGLINSLSISRVYIKKGLEGFADDFVGLGNSINEVNRIMANRVVFLNRLVFRGNLRTFGRNPAQIFLSWEIEKFQHLFLSSELQKVNRMIAPGRLMALLNENGSAYPVEQKIPNEIRRFFHEAWANNIVFSDFLQLEKRTFVASAIKGMNLESASLIYLYPRDLIENQIRELKIKIILGMALFLILATLLVTRFAIDRIKPVALLKSSLIAVAKQDFTARLNYRSSDEFNDLIAAFNVSIENMKDLALARTVQEGLLPPSDFSCGKIKVFAKTLFMTSMGGDYYDMTQTKNQILLAFGDVAGHGVPAALLMSMIKAIFSEHAENGRPQEFVQRCRDLMQYLKSRGDIRMMTLQFISIDPESGDYSLKNAGHCYPVHISNSGKQLDFIKAVSVPLGARTLPVSQSCKGKLSCGDYLILYSDGLVEALSPNGIMFGFARLAELFQKNFGNQPEVFCENILAEISGWNARQTDDLSILVLRFGE